MRPIARLAVALALAGCGGSTGDGGGGRGGDGGAADLAAIPPDLAAGAEPDCKDDLDEKKRGGACIHTVTGQLVTETGAPIDGTTITYCAGGCFFGTTGADGRFTVEVHEYLQPAEYSLLAHVNPRRAAYYLPPPPPAGTRIALDSPIIAPPMPASGPEIRDDMSAQAVHGDGVDLFIEAGTRLFFSVEDIGDLPIGKQLRPLRVPLPSSLPFLAGTGAAAVYGFGPFEADFRTRVRLAFTNAAGFPANAAVEVLAQRGLVRGAPPGWKLDVVATARVSPDGKTIEMDQGTGLDTLTWIALRKKGP